MKRMHIHVGVSDLSHSIRFYSALFDAAPVKTQPDYAKWMLDDPRINFAISTRPAKAGVDHLGLQVDEDDELDALRARLSAADLAMIDEGETVCCYARSDKSWLRDPSGIAWEAFRSMEDVPLFGHDARGETTGAAPIATGSRSSAENSLPTDAKTQDACCAPGAQNLPQRDAQADSATCCVSQ